MSGVEAAAPRISPARLAVLDPERFARVSRSAIVRLDAIRELVPLGHGDHEVRLRSGAALRWSRLYPRPFDPPA